MLSHEVVALHGRQVIPVRNRPRALGDLGHLEGAGVVAACRNGDQVAGADPGRRHQVARGQCRQAGRRRAQGNASFGQNVGEVVVRNEQGATEAAGRRGVVDAGKRERPSLGVELQ